MASGRTAPVALSSSAPLPFLHRSCRRWGPPARRPSRCVFLLACRGEPQANHSSTAKASKAGWSKLPVISRSLIKPDPSGRARRVISCMVNQGSFGFLRYSKQEYADFNLRLEYRFAVPDKVKPRKGNSGIGIRTVAFDPKRSTETRPSYAGYEIQLLDDAGKKPDKHSTGSLYRYVAPKTFLVKAAAALERLGGRVRRPANQNQVERQTDRRCRSIDHQRDQGQAPEGLPLFA